MNRKHHDPLSSHILSELQHLATVYGFLNKGILLEEISSEALHAKCANCIELTVSDAENIPFCSKKSFLKKTIKCFREIRFAFINRTRQPKASADLPQKMMFTLQNADTPDIIGRLLYGTEEKRCCKMLNFIKSEYYRMIHTTGIRVFFGILSVLTILLISGISIVETQYHTTSFLIPSLYRVLCFSRWWECWPLRFSMKTAKETGL